MSNNTRHATWLLFVASALSLVQATNYVTLDCDVVGDSECERMVSVMGSNSTTNGAHAKTLKAPTMGSGEVAAIVIGAITACVLIIIGLVIFIRWRLKRRRLRRQKDIVRNMDNVSSSSEEWDVTVVNSPTDFIIDQSNCYPREEEVVFRLSISNDDKHIYKP
ncbi:hypothetical protein GGI25_003596 [Coemansia spiralis]|uniref:Uncharacterized protein n=2 Tax=Coemansia TaxID=4863 RepID=A0A9W8G8C1_9FUNG|nr:hypothetical protein BX070DRAFT_226756 [Coemansia spiralis]KAJ1991151.1 hypothetical protein EDC05_003629 [Coemansia umbellata]KAJ2621272.1 hypothetical protein GGI26_004246 [Coemansia sp. RSA 1358]KAJ2676446.1 hypothetical protein GGI25_003596 [Coemansia spiralis]